MTSLSIQKSKPASSGNRAKIAVVALLLSAAAGYGFVKYRALNPQGINNGVTGDGPGRQEADMKQTRDEMQKYIGADAEQMKKLNEAWDKNPREAMQLARTVLTEDQQKKAREFMMQQFAKRDERMAKVMSPEDFAKFKEKRQQRFAGRFGRGAGGPGGPGGGPGGPPPGGGPGGPAPGGDAQPNSNPTAAPSAGK